MFINNGLTKLELDDTNKNSGFNLNTLCFMMKDKKGKQACYYLHEMTVKSSIKTPSKVEPYNWQGFRQSDFTNFELND